MGDLHNANAVSLGLNTAKMGMGCVIIAPFNWRFCLPIARLRFASLESLHC